MSDKEFGGSDDLSLPKATVQKIISEVLNSPAVAEAGQPGMTMAKDTRDLLIDCCVEFITMTTSEANDIAEKDAKKTISHEHITKALQELGFDDYVPELDKVAADYKTSQAVWPLTFHAAARLMLTLCCTDTREEAIED